MKTVLAVSVRLSNRALALFVLTSLWLGVSVSAQITGGTVAGQILNTDTGEYVRSATLRVEGSDLTAVSEDGGYYRLANVPAGQEEATIESAEECPGECIFIEV